MDVAQLNNVSVYTISSASKSAIPDWLARQNKKTLKQDPNWQNRVELIQDFQFAEASYRLRMTPDGQYMIATGTYKPQFRVYELSQMAMKFERHTDCENVQMEILSDDWKKIALLQADRTVELHSQFGLHFKTRIPKPGRDMKYHFPSCDLLMVGASHEVYRLNLDQGRFLNSYETKSPGLNVCAVNPANQLLSFGGEDGFVEFWDPRYRKSLGRNNVGSAVVAKYGEEHLNSNCEISALHFLPDGLTYAVGTSTGQTLLYDLRNSKPLLMKDHQSELPIKSLFYHESSRNIMSADAKSIKMWDKDTGKLFTAIEPENDINDVCIWNNTGLVMTANEGQRMNVFYIPALGPAPKWCSFLDNLTEELEENPNKNVYDDYKFITKKELFDLGLDNLIGTNVLRAYMHGYFIDMRLYDKARIIANPFAYEEFRKKLVRDKLETERQSRISATRRLPRVNRQVASRLIKHTKKTDDNDQEVSAANPLGDDRFKDMFMDAEFQVDVEHPEYTKYHTQPKKSQMNSNNFQKVQDDSDSELEGKASDVSTSSDEEAAARDSDASDELVRHRQHKKQQHPSSTNNERPQRDFKRKSKRPQFYEWKDHSNPFEAGSKTQMQRPRKSFAERAQSELSKHQDSSDKYGARSLGGAMSMQFSLNRKSSHDRDQGGGGRRRGRPMMKNQQNRRR